MAYSYIYISQVLEKRVAKAEQSNTLVIYFLEKDPVSIANTSFLLAAFLLLVVGRTVQEAAEPFVGDLAPFALAPFRDASFRPQVPYPVLATLLIVGV